MGRIFQIVQGADGFESIRHAWKNLTAQNPRSRYFHTYSWLRAYFECLEPDPDAMMFTLAVPRGPARGDISVQNRQEAAARQADGQVRGDGWSDCIPGDCAG